MAFRFEELKVWQIALRLCNDIDILVKNIQEKSCIALAHK